MKKRSNAPYKSSVTETFWDIHRNISHDEFKGWDPFDGLNSSVFKSLGKYGEYKYLRLVWIQFFKINPINLRKIFLVKKDYNAKGLALTILAYSNMYTKSEKSDECLHNEISRPNLNKLIVELSDKLLSIRSPGYNNYCWGYNFDWQNRVFFQPKYTPTVVPTSFCVEALYNAYIISQDKKYMDACVSACFYVLDDLNRYEDDESLIFSYSPLDNSRVYNASLLAARILARGYSLSGDKRLLTIALKAVDTIVKRQKENGSWIYGDAKVQDWIDSFHTGYNLECIKEIAEIAGSEEYTSSLESGMKYYINTFFESDGFPRYYDNKRYPVDIHSPAEFFVIYNKFNCDGHGDLKTKVYEWMMYNMFDSKQKYFYYQKRRLFINKINYMRWSQCFAFYALSQLILADENLD